MRTFLKATLFVIIWGTLLAGGYIAYQAHTFLTTAPSAEPREVVFGIEPGSTFDRVAWDLKKAGVITDVFRFRLLAQYHDALGRVKAGEFLLSTGWTPDKVLYQITQGQARLHRLSIREGLTWWETARAIETQGFATYEDFKSVIHDPEFLQARSIPFDSAEGFLYPETYLLKKPRSPLDREQAQQVADIMVRTFWKQTEPVWRQLPLRPELREQGASLPGKPLLPGTPGAMRSPSGGAVPEAVRSQVREGGSGHSHTLASDSVPPANVGTALPGTRTVVETGGLSAVTSAPSLSSTIAPEGDSAAGAEPSRLPASPGEQSGGRNGTPEAVTGQNAVRPESETAAGSARPEAHRNGAAAVPASPGQAEPGAVPLETSGPQTPGQIDPKALQRLIILASLVEKETGVPAERARVAGVYANRLRLNMLLQCDPTIIYGIGPAFSGSIRRSQIDDPRNLYNTYQHPGLPPGPICSSGLAAIQAAFAPEKHDYLYFVATGIDAGHTFSKTLGEHNKAVQVYRERMRANSKKK